MNYSEFFFFSTGLKRGILRRKVLIWCNNFFCSNQWNVTYINKNSFLLKMSYIQQNQAFLLFWIWFKIIDYLRKMLRITQKVIFYSTSLKRRKSWGIYWFDGGIYWFDGENKFFWSNQRDKYYQKLFSSLKWATYSYTKLFYCFETFSRKLTEYFSFGSVKWLSLKDARGDLTIFPENCIYFLWPVITFFPFFCANNYYTCLLLIVCALRWYVKSLYRHFFLEDIAKQARREKKMAPPHCQVL